MRSYATGKYSILKDGNFQLTMARVRASDFDSIHVAVPSDSSDYLEACAMFADARVELTMLEYGENALGTREYFWFLNNDELKFVADEYDLVISDINGFPGSTPVIYNFNITKIPELARPYIDKFFQDDLTSIRQSLFTTVLNPRQRDYILECAPDLLPKIHAHTKCAHSDFLPWSRRKYDEGVLPALFQNPPKRIIFWPFRLSDQSYRWTEFLQYMVDHELGDKFTVVITDPNESLNGELPSFVKQFTPTKEEYYKILGEQPIVVMLDDINKVLHPGTIEFFYYGCPTIAFGTNLILNRNSISSMSKLKFTLDILSRTRSPMGEFVYEYGEIDVLYNQSTVQTLMDQNVKR